MLFYLTNALLDVTFGVLWWTTKKTSYGIYNGILFLKNYNNINTETNIDRDNLDNYSNLIILTEDDYKLLKKIKKE